MKARLWQAICPWLDDFLAFGLESGEYREWSGGCIRECERAIVKRKYELKNMQDYLQNRLRYKGRSAVMLQIAIDHYWPTIDPRLP